MARAPSGGPDLPGRQQDHNKTRGTDAVCGASGTGRPHRAGNTAAGRDSGGSGAALRLRRSEPFHALFQTVHRIDAGTVSGHLFRFRRTRGRKGGNAPRNAVTEPDPPAPSRTERSVQAAAGNAGQDKGRPAGARGTGEGKNGGQEEHS